MHAFYTVEACARVAFDLLLSVLDALGSSRKLDEQRDLVCRNRTDGSSAATGHELSPAAPLSNSGSAVLVTPEGVDDHSFVRRRIKHRRVSLGAALGIVALLALALASVTWAAKPQPKPWQWTPEKVAKRLVAASTCDNIVKDGIYSYCGVFLAFEDGHVDGASCVGTSRAVAGRYSAFRCDVRTGGPNSTGKMFPALVRVKPIGSGLLCIPTTPEGRALPFTAGTFGVLVRPERRC